MKKFLFFLLNPFLCFLFGYITLFLRRLSQNADGFFHKFEFLYLYPLTHGLVIAIFFILMIIISAKIIRRYRPGFLINLLNFLICPVIVILLSVLEKKITALLVLHPYLIQPFPMFVCYIMTAFVLGNYMYYRRRSR